MANARTSIVKELEPGLNKVFGETYNGFDDEAQPLYAQETSDRSFEEEVIFSGFGAAPNKSEGDAVVYDDATELWVARYSHTTVALAFAITEEAMEDNLYEKLSVRLTKSLARSMAHTKQVKGAATFNNAQDSSYVGGDGVVLLSTAHPLRGGATLANRPSSGVDLSETALEDAMINVAGWTDDRGIPIAVQLRKLAIPVNLVFTAERLLKSQFQPDAVTNNVNAIVTTGMLPDGYVVNHRFTDTDAWFILTDQPDGLKQFTRVAYATGMEGDFETGNMRYKARERYCFGWSDWRGIYGSMGG